MFTGWIDSTRALQQLFYGVPFTVKLYQQQTSVYHCRKQALVTPFRSPLLDPELCSHG
jgi:hypothetical protein